MQSKKKKRVNQRLEYFTENSCMKMVSLSLPFSILSLSVSAVLFLSSYSFPQTPSFENYSKGDKYAANLTG